LDAPIMPTNVPDPAPMDLNDSHFDLTLATCDAEIRRRSGCAMTSSSMSLAAMARWWTMTRGSRRIDSTPSSTTSCCGTVAARRADVVGVYRLMRADQAQAAGQFYSEDEYDLGRCAPRGGTLLELGRSCLHRDYRGGSAMMHLWNGLADYIAATGSR
jgi:hypothetical protein